MTILKGRKGNWRMSNLTMEQVAELTERVKARLDEFTDLAAYMPRVSPGVIRLAFDVIEDWMATHDYLHDDSPTEWSQPADQVGDVTQMDYYHIGYERGYQSAVSETARLAPPHTNGFHPHTEEDLRGTQSFGDALAVPVTDDDVGGGEPVDDMAEFTAAWPDMPNLTGGVDHFAEHPVSGEFELPAQSIAETATPATQELAEKYSEPEPPALIEPLPEPVKVPVVSPAVPRRTPDAESRGQFRLGRPKDEMDKAEQFEQIIAALHEMAVDGRMPTIMLWDEERPGHLPRWVSIAKRHNLKSWKQLAAKAGLSYGPTVAADDDGDEEEGGTRTVARDLQLQKLKEQRRAAATMREQAARHDAKRVVTRDDLIAELRRQAMAGVMPSQSQFNMAKPQVWPTATALVVRLHTTWEELASDAGLRWVGKRRQAAA
jgi:hypothetical protein